MYLSCISFLFCLSWLYNSSMRRNSSCRLRTSDKMKKCMLSRRTLACIRLRPIKSVLHTLSEQVGLVLVVGFLHFTLKLLSCLLHVFLNLLSLLLLHFIQRLPALGVLMFKGAWTSKPRRFRSLSKGDNIKCIMVGSRGYGCN